MINSIKDLTPKFRKLRPWILGPLSKRVEELEDLISAGKFQVLEIAQELEVIGKNESISLDIKTKKAQELEQVNEEFINYNKEFIKELLLCRVYMPFTISFLPPFVKQEQIHRVELIKNYELADKQESQGEKMLQFNQAAARFLSQMVDVIDMDEECNHTMEQWLEIDKPYNSELLYEHFFSLPIFKDFNVEANEELLDVKKNIQKL